MFRLEKNILVVDLLNTAFRFINSDDYAFSLAAFIDSLSNDFGCKYVICLDDSKSKYRLSIYPEYKGKRKKRNMMMDSFFSAYKNAIDVIPYPILKVDGVEADDIACFICTKYHDEFDHIYLISTDKDWNMLLFTENIEQYSFKTQEAISRLDFINKHKYSPVLLPDMKALIGDPSDNINGVEGIGEKRAKELISKYGSALDIVESLPITDDNRPFIKHLNNSADIITRNLKLVDLLEYNEQALLGSENEIIRFMNNEVLDNHL